MPSLLAAVAASGCMLACPAAYEPVAAGKASGYIDHEGAGKLTLVSFIGNGFTAPQVVEKYAMYRAAEVARAKGKPYFVMYRSLHNAARDMASDRPLMGKAYATPIATSFILPLDLPRPDALQTDKVLEQLKDVVAPARGAAPTTN